MKDRDWQKVEEIFHSALALAGERRNSYLEKIGGENKRLRNEVESLLDSFDAAPEFMNESAFDLGLEILGQSTEEDLSDREIGSYLLLKKIGAGGMGNVYLAEDRLLNRKVALKFLASADVGDERARRQLIREARAAAMLEHPNICQIYSIEKTKEYDFIVMQYIEGETLSRQISEHKIRPEQILPIVRQIAEALAAAHSHGIIHRDIKPGNIIITSKGQIKVLDFGLAKTVRQNQLIERDEHNSCDSRSELVVGTVAYMSPEQLRNEKLDYRSDIFSFGILLYEIVAGTNPFKRETEADTITAILTGDIKPQISRQNGRIPPLLKSVIKKCLEESKEKRFQSANELLLEMPSADAPPVRRHKIHYAANLLIPAIILLSLMYGIFSYLRTSRTQSLAILPFINQTDDLGNDYLTVGMTEDLIERLSDSTNIKVKPFSLVSGYNGNESNTLGIGQDLKVDAVLTGALIRRGDNLFLQTKLINTRDGRQIWSTENPFDSSKVLIYQREISQKIISVMPASNKTGTDGKTSRESSPIVDPEVYRYYLKGRYFWSKRNEKNIREAIGNFNRAIELDPTFARAYTGLADSYVLLSSVAYGSVPTKEAMTKAKAAAKKALEIDERLCESHAALGAVLFKYERNWTAAEAEFKRAVELDPENATAHFWYSNLLAILGRAEESIDEAEKAKELDPFSPLQDMNLGRVFYYSRRYDESLERLNAPDSRNSPGVRYLIGLVYLQKGDYAAAIQIFEKLYTANKMLGGAALGYAYARTGRKSEALKIIAELENISAEQHLPPQEKAIIYIGLDEPDRAFEYLQAAFDERYAPLNSLKVEPLFDSLRSDPRYISLLDRMSLSDSSSSRKRYSEQNPN